MEYIKISIIQTDLYWENIPANLKALKSKIIRLKNKTDLIILPEMFTTGFTMNAEKLAETSNGSTHNFLKEMSATTGAYLCGSIIYKNKDKYFNRLLVSAPSGYLWHYDKRHLFRMAKENHIYSGGKHQLVLTIKTWRVAFFVCYDLRFPVWCRNVNNKYDIAVFVANWPERRIDHWRQLLIARAIENQSFVVGVNRIGYDGNGVYFNGNSLIIDPLGKIIFDAKSNAIYKTVTFEKHILHKFRSKFPVYKDADRFIIIK
ncbi:MAG: amidohydrolase [Ignavibacteria bacterium]